MNTPTKQTTLYYREGSSDKVYQVTLEPAGERFAVKFAYGRRGSTLSVGTQTNVLVDHARAQAIHDQLVREKTAKGCTPGESGTHYQLGVVSKDYTPLQNVEAFSFFDPIVGENAAIYHTAGALGQIRRPNRSKSVLKLP